MDTPTTAPERASFLTIPCELRNQIYMHIFQPNASDFYPTLPVRPDAIATALNPETPKASLPKLYHADRTSTHLGLLRTCKQIQAEAQLLALSMTPFRLEGECTYPELFDIRSRPLSASKIGAIRHITLTARIGHLRALNEAWLGLPFGHPSLHLDTLLIIPKRPTNYVDSFAEIADLSQSHTLAYIFCETLKGLRNVQCVEIRNVGCFNEVVWGGGKCGVKFLSGECNAGGTEIDENRWFRAYLSSKDDQGNECGEEVVRLVGTDVRANESITWPNVPVKKRIETASG
ncbi:uncharacterized protein MYCFIDRAFT_206832 [Pseudocercospora fijiensis CIRAD86]|uniref:Uncharacterized protein n=1 Tax=Pseudocercospora fijiensis (strain CIRAD86) TaxID=383855 RepID=M3BB06_PSEFD|nr:uncharacterized protein MYCFIDRAFT_206832 [Pseudocercospora fijiensis CIRAD86]EME86492.1 hypothetical protein MYCFIDRAFT_206832 [Pseudocercospora fijiensis CIRAD86]